MRTAFLWIIAATLACADTPEWQKSLSPKSPGPHPLVAPVQLDYMISWNGAINAGQVTWQFGEKALKPGEFPCIAKGNSLGLAASLFPYKFDAITQLNPATLRPSFFHCTETDKKTTTVFHVDFSDTGASSRALVRPHATGTDHVNSRSFAFAPMYDMFSSMLFVRSQALKDGDSILFVTHPFEDPYLCHVTVLGREKFNGTDAIKLDISLRKIAPDLSLLPYKKLKTATLWLSDDPDRVALELRAKIFIGDIRMTLTNKRML
jgi:hypothetical protein